MLWLRRRIPPAPIDNLRLRIMCFRDGPHIMETMYANEQMEGGIMADLLAEREVTASLRKQIVSMQEEIDDLMRRLEATKSLRKGR